MSNLPLRESVQLQPDPPYLLRTGISLPFFLQEGSWAWGPEGSLTLWGEGDAPAVFLPPWQLQAG